MAMWFAGAEQGEGEGGGRVREGVTVVMVELVSF